MALSVDTSIIKFFKAAHYAVESVVHLVQEGKAMSPHTLQSLHNDCLF
jgi:hypothetical protein